MNKIVRSVISVLCASALILSDASFAYAEELESVITEETEQSDESVSDPDSVTEVTEVIEDQEDSTTDQSGEETSDEQTETPAEEPAEDQVEHEHRLAYRDNMDGTHLVYCQDADCDYEDTVEHDFNDNGECVCGAHQKEEHNFVYTDNGDGTHTVTCSDENCDYEYIEPHVFNKEPLCICGAVNFDDYEYTDNGDGTHTRHYIEEKQNEDTTDNSDAVLEKESDVTGDSEGFLDTVMNAAKDTLDDLKGLFEDSETEETNEAVIINENDSLSREETSDSSEENERFKDVIENHTFIDGVCIYCGAEEMSEASLEEQQIAATFNRRVFTAKGIIPADAILSVKAVDIEEVQEKINKERGDESCVVSEAYDIKIMDGEKEYQPAEGTITVSVKNIIDTDEVEMSEGDFSISSIYHIDDEGNIDELQPNQEKEENGLTTVSFETPGFSTFVFSTVTYNTSSAVKTWNVGASANTDVVAKLIPYQDEAGKYILYVYGTKNYTRSKMQDFTAGSAPWYSYRNDIIDVYIDNDYTTYTSGQYVGSIGNYAFYNMPGLKWVSNDDYTVISIGDYAFANSENLISIYLDHVDSIGSHAFEGCTKLDVSSSSVIGNNLTVIKPWAFKDTATRADENAYYGSYTPHYNFNLSTVEAYTYQNCKNIKGLCFSNATTQILVGAYKGCTNLFHVRFFECSDLLIQNTAFADCSNLEEIQFEHATLSSPFYLPYTFYDAEGTAYTSLPAGTYNMSLYRNAVSVNGDSYYKGSSIYGDRYYHGYFECGYPDYKAVRAYCFTDKNDTTKKIAYIEGPGKVWNFARTNMYFMDVNSPERDPDNTYSYSMNFLSNYSLFSYDKIKTAVLAEGITHTGVGTFYDHRYLETIEFPSTLTTVGRNSFNNCTNLASVSIPDGVAKIDNGAFYNCNNIMSVSLPGSVSYIGNSSFYNCLKLNEISIPTGVTTIGTDAFKNCSSLAKITLNNVTLTSDYVLPYKYYRSDRSEITTLSADTTYDEILYKNLADVPRVPRETWLVGKDDPEDVVAYLYYVNFTDDTDGYSLELVGTGAVKDFEQTKTPWFESYKSLIKSVVVGEGITYIGNFTFASLFNNEEVSLSSTLTSIGEHAFENNRKLVTVVVPDSVSIIGEYVFQGCWDLKNINIPTSLETIPFQFLGSTGIESITIPSNVKVIDNTAFNSCNSLEAIVLDNVELTEKYSILGYYPRNTQGFSSYYRSNREEIYELEAGVVYTETITKTMPPANLLYTLEGKSYLADAAEYVDTYFATDVEALSEKVYYYDYDSETEIYETAIAYGFSDENIQWCTNRPVKRMLIIGDETGTQTYRSEYGGSCNYPYEWLIIDRYTGALDAGALFAYLSDGLERITIGEGITELRNEHNYGFSIPSLTTLDLPESLVKIDLNGINCFPNVIYEKLPIGGITRSEIENRAIGNGDINIAYWLVMDDSDGNELYREKRTVQYPYVEVNNNYSGSYSYIGTDYGSGVNGQFDYTVYLEGGKAYGLGMRTWGEFGDVPVYIEKTDGGGSVSGGDTVIGENTLYLEGDERIYSFMPDEDGEYHFYSTNDGTINTSITVYDGLPIITRIATVSSWPLSTNDFNISEIKGWTDRSNYMLYEQSSFTADIDETGKLKEWHVVVREKTSFKAEFYNSNMDKITEGNYTTGDRLAVPELGSDFNKPTVEGYNTAFLGWKRNEDRTVYSANEIAAGVYFSDQKFTAVYGVITNDRTFTVTFYDAFDPNNDGIDFPDKSDWRIIDQRTYHYGDRVIIPVVTNTYTLPASWDSSYCYTYTFEGWNIPVSPQVLGDAEYVVRWYSESENTPNYQDGYCLIGFLNLDGTRYYRGYFEPDTEIVNDYPLAGGDSYIWEEGVDTYSANNVYSPYSWYIISNAIQWAQTHNTKVVSRPMLKDIKTGEVYELWSSGAGMMIPRVTAAADYQIVFNEISSGNTVTFKDHDGSILGTDSVEEGAIILPALNTPNMYRSGDDIYQYLEYQAFAEGSSGATMCSNTICAVADLGPDLPDPYYRRIPYFKAEADMDYTVSPVLASQKAVITDCRSTQVKERKRLVNVLNSIDETYGDPTNWCDPYTLLGSYEETLDVGGVEYRRSKIGIILGYSQRYVLEMVDLPYSRHTPIIYDAVIDYPVNNEIDIADVIFENLSWNEHIGYGSDFNMYLDVLYEPVGEATYSVICNTADGKEVARFEGLRYGDQLSLPYDSIQQYNPNGTSRYTYQYFEKWVDESGNAYGISDTITVDKNKVFTAYFTKIEKALESTYAVKLPAVCDLDITKDNIAETFNADVLIRSEGEDYNFYVDITPENSVLTLTGSNPSNSLPLSVAVNKSRFSIDDMARQMTNEYVYDTSKGEELVLGDNIVKTYGECAIIQMFTPEATGKYRVSMEGTNHSSLSILEDADFDPVNIQFNNPVTIDYISLPNTQCEVELTSGTTYYFNFFNDMSLGDTEDMWLKIENTDENAAAGNAVSCISYLWKDTATFTITGAKPAVQDSYSGNLVINFSAGTL